MYQCRTLHCIITALVSATIRVSIYCPWLFFRRLPPEKLTCEIHFVFTASSILAKAQACSGSISLFSTPAVYTGFLLHFWPILGHTFFYDVVEVQFIARVCVFSFGISTVYGVLYQLATFLVNIYETIRKYSALFLQYIYLVITAEFVGDQCAKTNTSNVLLRLIFVLVQAHDNHHCSWWMHRRRKFPLLLISVNRWKIPISRSEVGFCCG